MEYARAGSDFQPALSDFGGDARSESTEIQSDSQQNLRETYPTEF